jgi:MFS family permease
MDSKVPLPRLTVRDQLVLSVFWLSLNAQSAALFPIVIPLQILLFLPPGQVGNVQQAVLLGWISTVGAIVSLVMPPLFGMASDRSTSRFGRRRPYIVAGTLLLILGAFLLAAAGNVLIFLLGMIVWQFGSNAANASYQALLPDRVPKDQRGEASGYMGLMTIIGNVGSLGLAAFLLADVNLTSTSGAIIRRGANLFYLLTGIVLFVGMLITAVGVHEMQYRHTLTRAARTEGVGLH